MKRNFFAGLLTGLCGALLIFTLFGAVLIYVGNKEGQDNNSATVSDGNTKAQASEKTEQISYSNIVKKLTFLQGLVDEYYLEDVKENTFADGIYKGFISSLDDPYSTYYTEDEYKALMESSSGVYCGIGATVSQNADTGVITIVKPFEGSPAHKAGILPGDVIYKVDGKEVTGDDLSEVVSNMKGIEGSKVVITVIREGKSDPIDFTVKRAQIEVPTVDYKLLDNKIGYISILQFDEVTVEQFNTAVDALEAKGMKGLIVDVRDNPGGLLTAVVKILDRLVKPGLVVYTEDKYGNREEEKATDKDAVTIPMAVLINGNSASASEIFAGTLQDDKVATVIGTTSFGKGIVQKVIPLSDGSAVKLTISKYYTPSGRNIHGVGITPDIKVELDKKLQNELTIPVDKDNQLQKAISTISKKIK